LRPHQQILETWEGSDCTVAVARDSHGLSIKINSHYGLGSTGAMMQQKLQADIPMMIRPGTESIFFLGTGTGVTAGSALDPQFPNVKRVVTCELVPEVIVAARKYMTSIDGFDCTGGLFSDPRATVLIEDGRHYLMASGDRFDMVNADLFVPFRSGAGSLYSKEHFACVKRRLERGGIFVQWLPLYQITENEFSIIARTMLAVFDQVSLWRSTFQPGEEVVALVGHPDSSPLPACTLDSRADKQIAIAGKNHRDLDRLQLPFNPQTIMFFYCGNVTAAGDLFANYPVNSDDRPFIEYMAPRTYRGESEAPLPWFVGPRFVRLVEEIQRRCPPEDDPLLAHRTSTNRRLPVAGAAFHRARLWQVIGDEQACRQSWLRFVEAWNDQDAGPVGGGGIPATLRRR
jgi:spermidine synthase